MRQSVAFRGKERRGGKDETKRCVQRKGEERRKGGEERRGKVSEDPNKCGRPMEVGGGGKGII